MEWALRLLLAALVIGTAPLWWRPIRSLPTSFAERRWADCLRGLALLGAVGFAGIQLVPIGWEHSNPPITGEPQWDSATTRDLAVRACFDCHSNETGWTWYSYVAPVSWLVVGDVLSGREELNFSEWDRDEAREEARDAARVIERGSMPPAQYELAHPESRLTHTEAAELAEGLRRSIGAR
jgi:hypothetical protein